MMARSYCENAMQRALDWDDLRLVLAVARARGLPGAARSLGVNHTTAFRRLNALEAGLGTRLFDRLPGGYQPTAPGAQAVAAAERMEDEVAAVDRALTGRDLALTGRLRVTTADTLAQGPLARHLAAFRAAHPGIALDLVVDNRFLSLTKREADVALRTTRPSQPGLVGRKVATIAWTLYGAVAALDRRGTPSGPAALPGALPRALKDHALIGWESGEPAIPAEDWLAQQAPGEAFVLRTASVLTQAAAAAAGIGLAMLPCFVGDAMPGLRRVLPPPPELARELWLLTHRDLQRTARVRAFMDEVGAALVAERALYAGEIG